MDGSFIQRLLIGDWQRKLVALITALIIWLLVDHSITATKTLSSVPIRVINLPADKTIQGLLPNGFISKRATLTLTGTKDVIEQLEPSDLEVLLDVSNLASDGIVQITKKNLVSLNPDINLYSHITAVTHSEFVIKMSSVLIEKIPLTIRAPIGDPPKGYTFLDIWPITLSQTVSGPREQVLSLKNEGLSLAFNLSDITKEQLDNLKAPEGAAYDDEVSFPIPYEWKKVVIPFLNGAQEPLNDPEAKNLHMVFLRKEAHRLPVNVPIRVFYPVKTIATLNPKTYTLAAQGDIKSKDGIAILELPLYTSDVSQLFLDIVKDNIEIDIVAAPKEEREKLEWSMSVIDASHLEDSYTAFLISALEDSEEGLHKTEEREQFFRKRFRTYLQNFTLYHSGHHKLELDSTLSDGKVIVHVPKTP